MHATSQQLDYDYAVEDDMIRRLCQVTEDTVIGLVEGFSTKERANLAMFCYRKAHLHHLALQIAATCELSTLMDTFGAIVGQTLFAQSQEHLTEGRRAPINRRPKISVAKSSEIHRTNVEDAGNGVDQAVNEVDTA